MLKEVTSKAIVILIVLGMVGCNMKYHYASDRYMELAMDMCDGKVKEYKPRNGEVVCDIQAK